MKPPNFLLNKSGPYTVALLIAIITVVVYLPALQNGFVNFDDNEYVYNNPNIRSIGPYLLKWSITAFHSSNWHPLTWLSHAVDYAVWGLNPMGHHLTSVVLHCLNTFLVVILVFNLINLYKYKSLSIDISQQYRPSYRKPLFASAVAGMLFGLHPLHVESVAWVSERKDLLCAFFFLLSILSYIRYANASPDRQKNRAYFVSIIFFILALVSKPMAVTLPVILIILDVYPLERIDLKHVFTARRRVLIEKVPFFVLSFASAILTILAQQKAMPSLELFPFTTRGLVAVRAIGFYLVKIIFPKDLAPLYPHPRELSSLPFDYIFAILFVSGFTIYCVRSWSRKKKLWTAVWLYYLVTLLPVLGIIQVGGQAAADRYTYLPSLGPFLVAGLCVADVWDKFSERMQRSFSKLLSALILSLVILIPLSALTIKQISIWKNSITLWDAELRLYPDSYRAYFTRGNYYYEKGMLKKALDNFDKAIELHPQFARAYYDRGIVYEDLGNDRQALEDYGRAIAFKPDYQLPYNNRGTLYGKMGLYMNALKDFDMAVRLNDQDSVAYFNRGLAHRMLGNHEKANEDFQTAYRLGNENALSHLNRELKGR
jgi:hypothetical protein